MFKVLINEANKGHRIPVHHERRGKHLHRSPRIYSKMVKYSIILKYLGILDVDDVNKITKVGLSKDQLTGTGDE